MNFIKSLFYTIPTFYKNCFMDKTTYLLYSITTIPKVINVDGVIIFKHLTLET